MTELLELQNMRLVGIGWKPLAASKGRTTHLPFIFIAVEGDRNLLGIVEMLCSLSSDHLHFKLTRKDRPIVRLEDNPAKLGREGGLKQQRF